MKRSLRDLARKYNTDKGPSKHNYTEIYQNLFDEICDKKINLLEIGVEYGNSLKMWHDYFINGRIYGLDYFAEAFRYHRKGWTKQKKGDLPLDEISYVAKNIKKEMPSDRVECLIGSQNNRNDLESTVKAVKEFDIIIDDGVHRNEDVQISLGYLFKHLKSGGFYIIEDVVWSTRRNSNEDLVKEYGKTISTIKMMKQFTDTKEIESTVMFDEEKRYLCENIDSWKLQPAAQDALLIIRKK